MPHESTNNLAIYDTIIVGGGAAGLSAAIYAGRYLMRTLVLEGPTPGGETAVAWLVENYPGVPSIDGYELMQKMRSQAVAAGAEIATAAATSVQRDAHCFTVSTDQPTTYLGKTVIIAQGSTRRRLGLPREKELTGHGISYCATCDAPLYRGKTVAIIGGGDASVKGAILAGAYASRVFLIVRGSKLRAEPVNEVKMKSQRNTEILFSTEVREILGDGQLRGIRLSQPYGGSDTLDVQGLFVEIGAEPNTAIATTLGISVDSQGYIKVNSMMHTSVHGVYAAGDITNGAGNFRQDIVAAAQGALAATAAYHDLGVHGGEACELHARPPARPQR